MCPSPFSLSTLEIKRSELRDKILASMETKNLTFKKLAEDLKVNKAWLTSVILGENPATKKVASGLLQALSVPGPRDEHISILCRIPENRGQRDMTLPRDPMLRRFEELLDVYGDAFKAIVREEAGDGVMSSTDCTVNFETIKDGDDVRIVVKVEGKFLKYQQ